MMPDATSNGNGPLAIDEARDGLSHLRAYLDAFTDLSTESDEVGELRRALAAIEKVLDNHDELERLLVSPLHASRTLTRREVRRALRGDRSV